MRNFLLKISDAMEITTYKYLNAISGKLESYSHEMQLKINQRDNEYIECQELIFKNKKKNHQKKRLKKQMCNICLKSVFE